MVCVCHYMSLQSLRIQNSTEYVFVLRVRSGVSSAGRRSQAHLSLRNTNKEKNTNHQLLNNLTDIHLGHGSFTLSLDTQDSSEASTSACRSSHIRMAWLMSTLQIDNRLSRKADFLWKACTCSSSAEKNLLSASSSKPLYPDQQPSAQPSLLQSFLETSFTFLCISVQSSSLIDKKRAWRNNYPVLLHQVRSPFSPSDLSTY